MTRPTMEQMSTAKQREANAWIHFLVIAVVTALIIGGICIAYAHHVGEQSKKASERALVESQQQFCGLLSTLDDSYTSTPPSSPTGVRIAQEIHNLRHAYRCS